MNKNLIIACVMAVFAITANAQTFTDSFESYSAGSYLAKSSGGKWTTWDGSTGGTTDVKVATSDAHSGKNSIYFSSTQAKGGPTDLVLPFGGAYSSGDFTMTLWLKIPSGKEGYFNIQGTTKVGTVWAISVYMGSDASLKIQDNTNKDLINGTYPQGKWFPLTLTGKLNSASWEVFADNISQGKTQIAYYSVASADFYPANNNNEMWMDDVSFKYTSFATPTLDAALGVVQIAGVKLKGLMDTVKTDVRNLGNKAITSVDVSVTHNGATVSESFSGLNITTGNVKTLNFTTMIAVAEGKNPITAAITKVNGTAGDDYSGDDSVITSAFGVTPTPGKIIIAEEKTGTWCPWCVRGTVYMGFMNQNYGKYWAGIAVHNKDPMTVTKYDSFSSADWSGGYPNLIFMRDSLFDPQGVEAKFLKEIVKPISCTLKNGATWDATSRTLKVSVTSDYIKNVNGDWRAACVLTEDSVTGTGSTYSQANAYAKNSNGKMGGFENLPNPVPYSQMKYDDVARVILPHTNGVAGMLPTNIKTGEKHTINLEYVLPATWNEKKINLVSFIIKPDGSIDNGTKSSIDEAITNGFVAVGIEENTALKSEIDMFPNPGSDIINVNLINAGNKNTVLNFRNIEGKLIQQYVVNPTATYSSTAIDISSLPQGVYFVDMNINGQKITKKFVKISQ